MSSISSFQSEWDLSKLEARELYDKSRRLSDGFIQLSDYYKYDYILETQAYRKRWVVADRTSTSRIVSFVKDKYARRTLGQNARAMWDVFLPMEKNYRIFQKVVWLHKIAVDGNHLATQTDEEILTRVLEIRHECGDIKEPEKVIEGRRAFEAISRVRRDFCCPIYTPDLMPLSLDG